MGSRENEMTEAPCEFSMPESRREQSRHGLSVVPQQVKLGIVTKLE